VLSRIVLRCLVAFFFFLFTPISSFLSGFMEEYSETGFVHLYCSKSSKWSCRMEKRLDTLQIGKKSIL
jgi:hypothetical protein